MELKKCTQLDDEGLLTRDFTKCVAFPVSYTLFMWQYVVAFGDTR